MNTNRNAKTESRFPVHMLCGVTALLCIAVMFVPMGRERGHGNRFGEVLYRGEMQFAYCHSVSGFDFDSDQSLYKVALFALAVAALLLLAWAILSFRRRANAGGTGLAASVVNALVTALMIMFMTVDLGGYAMTIPVAILAVLLAAAAVVLASIQKKSER